MTRSFIASGIESGNQEIGKGFLRTCHHRGVVDEPVAGQPRASAKLTGTVPSLDVRRWAVSVARSMTGAGNVVDELAEGNAR